MEQEQETQESQETSHYEADAREMGWVNEEEWEGDKDKWVDARTFIERGENILPILRANNKRLKKDLLTRDKEISTLKESVEAANKAIKALQKHHNEATAQAVEQAKKDLKAQLREAREIGDLDAEEQIQDKLSELRQAPKEPEEPVEEKDKGLHPDFISWRDEHPWFTDTSTPESRKRIKEFTRIAQDLREDGDTSVGKAFMDKCLKILEEREGKGKRGSSKVEGASNGGRTSGGRGFDSLPKEAKDACHDDNENFVGPGRMFKTVKEWEDHFYNVYNEE